MDENTKTIVYFICVAINIGITWKYGYWNKNNGVFLLIGISWGPAGTFLLALGLLIRFIQNKYNIKLI